MGTVVECIDTIGLRRAPELARLLRGEVLAPGECGYDEARRGWDTAVDQHPAWIVMAKEPGDVVAAVLYAAAHDLGVAVMATGHGPVRPADGAMLIVTSAMTDVTIHPETQTATVAAGAKWGHVLEKAQAFGLAPLLGSSPDVGAVGFSLGGGHGWLARKYGVATDSVRSFTVVLVTGEVVKASPTENEDLFWGLRGGGGSLAIVTEMEIALYPVTTVYAGNLYYPAEMAHEVLTRFGTWVEGVPRELTSSVVLMNFPPLPMVPEPFRGKSFVIVRGCYAGDSQEGAWLIDEWRSWRAPLFDAFGEMPFSAVATISNDPVEPMPSLTTGLWLWDVGPETADILIRHTLPHDGPPPVLFSEVRHAAGAIVRVDPESTAYGHRSASLLLGVIAMAPTPEAQVATMARFAALEAALKPHATGGVYTNFAAEARREHPQDAFSPEAYLRLRRLKSLYDPENMLRYGLAILPEG